MEIIPREQWGAQYARGFGPAPLPAQELWLHHSVTKSAGIGATFEQDCAGVRQLEQIGQDRFGGGISYTFVACESGRVFEGHGVDRQGAHTGGRNSISRALCLLGDYQIRPPTSPQLAATAELVAHGHACGWWDACRLDGGHRDAPGASTSCPGDQAHALIPEINQAAQTGGDMTPEESARLARLETGLTLVLQQLIGPGATIENPWPGEDKGGGWDHWNPTLAPGRFTLVDLSRQMHSAVRFDTATDDATDDPARQ